MFAGVLDFRKSAGLQPLSGKRKRLSAGFVQPLYGLCSNMYTAYEHLSHVSKPYYPQYAAPYAETFRRIWRIFQGLSRNLSGGFVRPLQGLKNLCFILFIALSRFLRILGHFPYSLSLSLKISCATCKTFKRTYNVPLTVSLTPFSVSFSVSLTEYAASFGKICRSFNRK